MDTHDLLRSRLTRRGFLVTAIGASGAALLAACADDDDEPTDEPAQEPDDEEDDTPEPADDEDEDEDEDVEPEPDDEDDGDMEGQAGGTLRYGIGNDPPTMDPHVFSGAASDMLYGLVYSGLVRYLENWDVEGYLAESWEADGDTTFIFNLREGVKFHDGADMTAEDVKFSFDRIMDEATGAYVRSLLATSFESAEVVDDLTVQLNLSEVNAAFLAALALPTAAIVSQAHVEGGADLSATMNGTGPFKYVSREPNVELRLEKHTEFHEEGKPYLDEMILVPLSDETARSSGLRTGAVDFIDFVPWKDIAAIESEGFDIRSDTESSGLWMFMKVTLEHLDDPRVRRAVNLAINREAVVQSAFFGRGEVMDSIFVPKTSWAYVEDLPGVYTYDPDEARALLAEAGAEGFQVQFVSTSEVAMHLSGAEVVHANLRDVGIDATLETQDWASTVQKQNAGEYEMIMWGGGPLYGDPDYLSGYFRTGNNVPRNTGYSNPELDELLDSARQTLDQGERLEIYRQVYDILLDESPWIPLCYREQGEAMATHVKGYNRVLGSNWNGYRLAMTWIEEE